MSREPIEELLKFLSEIDDDDTEMIERMNRSYDEWLFEIKEKAGGKSEFDPGESTIEWKLENSKPINNLLVLRDELKDNDRRDQNNDILISGYLGEWILEACEEYLGQREGDEIRFDASLGLRQKIGDQSPTGAMRKVAMRDYWVKFFRILRHQYEFSLEVSSVVTVNFLNIPVGRKQLEAFDREIVGYKKGKAANYVSTLECDDRWIRGILDTLDEPCIRGILDKLVNSSPQKNAFLEALKRKRKAK